MNTDTDKTLRSLRIVWAALLAGQIGFILVIFTLWRTGGTTPNPQAAKALLMLAIGYTVAAPIVAHLLRMQAYKKQWQADIVTPAGYFTGNLLFLAVLEGASMLWLVLMLLAGKPYPYLFPAVMIMAVQVLNYPNGRPMHPHEPRL